MDVLHLGRDKTLPFFMNAGILYGLENLAIKSSKLSKKIIYKNNLLSTDPLILPGCIASL
jgi:hypothetical protein